MTFTWCKVVRESSWGTVDKLAGVPLTDGERIEVRWPDGAVTQETARVDRVTKTVSEQGSLQSTPITHQRAFLRVDVHGAPARVRLVGLEARRVGGLARHPEAC